MLSRTLLITAVTGLMTFGTGAALADQPPADAIPLSQIIQKLEEQGMQVVEVEYDDEQWQIEAYRGDEEVELEIDPVTGETDSED